ncbi:MULTISPECIES: hypothetical protein [unclassified Morganella (in: enterobacteria)]|uniref:hypothetical protein n=1 Tax=unclassified Morganella (in: enterobacteria) TaxID=2676694 RepID=UPI0029425744|nr:MULTISPECIES: hypothetical protein [unclassified Morganella (in: enterobacteria)]
MKRGVFLSVIIALLAGCKETPPASPDGYYVIDAITVTYDNPKDNAPENSDPDKNVKAAIRGTMVSLKDTTFFYFEPDRVIVDNSGNRFDSEIRGNTFDLNDIQTTWTSPDNGQTVYLTTEKEGACGFFNCEMKMTLSRADHTSEKLAGMKAVSDARASSYEAYLETQRQYYKQHGFQPVSGDPVRMTKNISVTLPETMVVNLKKQEDGDYVRDIGGIHIESDDDNTEIYRFRDPLSDAEGRILLVKMPKYRWRFDEWLNQQKGIVYQEENGAIYYNRWGKPECTYFRYDHNERRYVIIVAETAEQTMMRRMYSIARSAGKNPPSEVKSSQ